MGFACGGPSGRLVETCPTVGAYGLGSPHHSGRTRQPRLESRGFTQASRRGETALREAESAYLAGRSLKGIAKDVGIGHERLSRLLRERGLRLRRQSPSREETAEMQIRHREGASLEQIGMLLGYSAGTVRAHLLAAGTVLRDAHGR